MATQEQCEAALTAVAKRLGGEENASKPKLDERSLSCTVTDLGLVYRGRLHAGQLDDVRLANAAGLPTAAARAEDAAPAQLRLSLASDDLVALSVGELDFAKAWMKGRVKLEASFADLLRLRSLL
ncbi:MAG: hypothetical protein JWN61_468 [Pseudonocardiales bacterium]|nr:hypothetical protein [Pseudonocardiales bacterium]